MQEERVKILTKTTARHIVKGGVGQFNPFPNFNQYHALTWALGGNPNYGK